MMNRSIKFVGFFVAGACLLLTGCPDKSKPESSDNTPVINANQQQAETPVTVTRVIPEADQADVTATFALLEQFKGKYEKNEVGAVVAISLKMSNVLDQAAQDELFDAINKLIDLEKVTFDGPGVDDDSIVRLTNLKKVKTALFENASITTASLKMMAETMEDLTTLAVNRCMKLDGNSISAITKGMPKLKNLDLQSTAFKTFDLRTLPNLTELEQLDLRQCTELDGNVMKYVAGIPALKVLRLKGKIYRDSSMENLAGHPTLKALLLQDADVTNDFLDSVTSIPMLIDLSMFRLLDIDNDGMEKLEGAKLQILFIRENDWIDDEGIAVIKTMPDLRRLTLYELRAVTDEGLIAAISGKKNLVNLAFYDMEGITDKSIEALRTTTALRNLELGKTGQTDATLKLASLLPRLETITIGDNSKFTDTGLAFLGESKSLKTIAIMNITGITAGAIEEFRVQHPAIEIKFRSTGGQAE